MKNNSINPPIKECPICGHQKIRYLGINREYPLFLCHKCKVHFLKRKESEKLVSSYKKKYFFEDYAKQYGKTYIQDRDNIRAFSVQRLDQIEHVLQKPLKGVQLLDIGCAYCFFLEVARERGAVVSGIEIVPEAVRYAKKRLSLKVYQQDLNFYEPPEKLFDVITLWYVLEHFENPDLIISRLAKALKPGGVLALSIPNASGYSARCHQPSYLQERPSDHYYDFSPSSITFLANLFGLKVERIVAKGVHFSRFKAKCRALSWVPDKKIFHQLFSSICRIFRIGDTMEVYLRKG